MDCLHSDFWVFDTPIYPEWIPVDHVRKELERGANCENRLSEELQSVLIQNLLGINTMYLSIRFVNIQKSG